MPYWKQRSWNSSSAAGGQHHGLAGNATEREGAEERGPELVELDNACRDVMRTVGPAQGDEELVAADRDDRHRSRR